MDGFGRPERVVGYGKRSSLGAGVEKNRRAASIRLKT
jgi:hypothetical protein